MNILWSPEAIDDLRSVRDLIAEDNPAVARAVVLHIMHNIEHSLTIRRWDVPAECPAHANS